MCVHVSECHIASVFRSMAIGFVANADNRLSEQRRVVRPARTSIWHSLCSYQLGSIPGRAKIFLLCTASRPPLGLNIPISAVTAVLFPVIRLSVVTTYGRAVLCVLACCLWAQWQLYVAAPVAVLVTDRNSCMIWDTRHSGCGSSSIRFVFVLFWGHQRWRRWYTAFIIALVTWSSCRMWKWNLFSTVILKGIW